MSKELAQAVGGKRTVWLFAVLLAAAFMAMVATPWQSASAQQGGGLANIDLEKEIEGDTNVFNIGDQITFNITVSNYGLGTGLSTAPTDTVHITDILPAQVDPVSFTAEAPYDCDINGQTVTCSNEDGSHSSSLDGNSRLITVTADVVDNTDGGIGITNLVTGTYANGDDPDPASALFYVTILPENERLVHLNPFGEIIDERDDENNLIGFQHVVCLWDPERELVGGDDWTFAGIVETLAPPSADPDDLYWRIQTLSGNVSVNGQTLTERGFDTDGAAVDLEDADIIVPCVEWFSNAPGEQNITVINGLNQVVADYTGINPDGGLTNPLVKEWNVLEPTAITLRDEWLLYTANNPDYADADAYDFNVDGTTITRTVYHDTASNTYEALDDVDLLEHVFGSHQSVGGPVGPLLVDGALVTFSVSGTCGMAEIDGDTTLEGDDVDIYAGGASATVTSVGLPIEFDVTTDNCVSQTNSYTTVTISVAYPVEIGSVQPGTPDDETITVNWVSEVPMKNVWLAWAGQRTVITADWMVGEGPGSYCPYGESSAQFLKSSGPGTFDPHPDVEVYTPAEAWTFIDQDCTASVIFESEEPGQVDVEAFAGGQAASKQAFVIYYMKIEDVNVSLVADENGNLVEKDSHNGSAEGYRDWTPSNPWNVENDVMTADQNVSTDVLVRARVRGWFTNSNPSGRPAAGSFGENPRPADRWIMPDDWGLLIGGTLDGAVNYQTRPEFDTVFAPSTSYYVDDYNFVAEQPGLGDLSVDRWDAPMPPAPVTLDIRGAGFLKEVHKHEVYYRIVGGTKVYTNPYYYAEIPNHPMIPAGNYFWDTFGIDGWYEFWQPVFVDRTIYSPNSPDTTVTAAQWDELDQIRLAYDDDTIGRTLVVFSDNHGEAMVAANGDFKLTYDECATNAISGGQHCDLGDLVGTSTISAQADYPDFRGKHPVIRSVENAEIDWTWGGYKEVTIEPGETDQFQYVVFRALDRDGFCAVPTGSVSLHPVLTSADQAVIDVVGGTGVGAGAQLETVDFVIDSDEGGRFVDTSSGTGYLGVTRETVDGLPTFVADQDSMFPPLNGAEEECQAWVRISNSLLGVTNVLVNAHNDEGDIGFDTIVDFDAEHEYRLNFRWSLITWLGADDIAPADALRGEGANEGGNDIYDQVTAIYGWEASSQEWLAYFPAGEGIPGANDLTGLETGDAYWIAIKGPDAITWNVMTNVN